MTCSEEWTDIWWVPGCSIGMSLPDPIYWGKGGIRVVVAVIGAVPSAPKGRWIRVAKHSLRSFRAFPGMAFVWSRVSLMPDDAL